jgi:hypothetical protein
MKDERNNVAERMTVDAEQKRKVPAVEQKVAVSLISPTSRSLPAALRMRTRMRSRRRMIARGLGGPRTYHCKHE